MKRSRHRLILVILGLIAIVTASVAADWLVAVPMDTKPTYIGRQACARCHQPELHAWTDSPHDKAMDLATAATVLGDFNDAEITYQGVTSRMFRRDDAYFIHTEGPDGELADFEIKYVFGYDPLQQYMIEFPDGRVQVPRVSWDTHRQRWFYQYPPDVRDEKLKPDDPLHWTRRGSNWNHMCAECHSTNVHKNYDVADNHYDTTFSEIDVSCETCHGPGSLHVELAEAKSLFWDRNHGYGLPKLKAKQSEIQIESCAKCHARRHVVYPNFRPGTDFLDHFAPSLLREDLYHADGQILDEVYVYGSFLQSKMHAKGIRCTDCHNPHSTELKFESNQLCTSCHQHSAAKYDVPAHHHHKPGSPGAQCVECHMPAKHYMIVDPRRDHSLRVPRPDLSVQLDTPNACTACHLDTTKSDKWEHYADWLAAAGEDKSVAREEIDRVDLEMLKAVEKWYGKRKDKKPHYAFALHAARNGDTDAEELLTDVLRNKEVPDIVKATAIQHLADLDTRTSRATVTEHIADPDPLISAIAIRGLKHRGYDPEVLIKTLEPLLQHPVRMVRTEAALVLAPSHRLLNATQSKAFNTALDEYRTGQDADRDQAGSHYNLGNLAQDMAVGLEDTTQTAEAQKLFTEAVGHYKRALAIDPLFTIARFNLAMLYSRTRQDKLAEKHFRALAEEDPDAALPLYRLGLVLGRTGRFKEAEKYLSKAHKLEPGNFDYLYALGIFYLEIRDWPEAERIAGELLRLYPNVRRSHELKTEIKRRRQPPGQEK